MHGRPVLVKVVVGDVSSLFEKEGDFYAGYIVSRGANNNCKDSLLTLILDGRVVVKLRVGKGVADAFVLLGTRPRLVVVLVCRHLDGDIGAVMMGKRQ